MLRSRFRGFPGLWRDAVHSARSLARTPALAVTIVVTVGVGLGATTGMISVVRAVLVNPLPSGVQRRSRLSNQHGHHFGSRPRRTCDGRVSHRLLFSAPRAQSPAWTSVHRSR
jgi:hypothetical protein